MKDRRHHNNSGLRQIKRGKTRDQVKWIARRLGVSYGRQKEHESAQAPASEAVHEVRECGKAEARAASGTDGDCPPQATAINAP